MKWAYKVEAVFRGPTAKDWIGESDLQARLDALGEDGWELVATHSAVPGEPNEGIFLICKRPQGD